MQISSSVIAAALALTLSGLSGAMAQDEPAAPARKNQAEGKARKQQSDCAFRRQIRGYSVIDGNHFVLRAGRRRFLVTLSSGCYDLKRNTAIGIKRSGGSICVARGDRVIVDHGFTCVIRDIEGVENREEAVKLVEERRKAEEEAEDRDG